MVPLSSTGLMVGPLGLVGPVGPPAVSMLALPGIGQSSSWRLSRTGEAGGRRSLGESSGRGTVGSGLAMPF